MTGGSLSDHAMREAIATAFREYSPRPRHYDHAGQRARANFGTTLVVNELPARIHRAIFAR